MVILGLVAVSSAARLVNFDDTKVEDQRSLAQNSRDEDLRNTPGFLDFTNMLADLSKRTEFDSECNDECMERRAVRMLPIARRFASRIGGHLARRFMDEDNLKSHAKRLAESMNEARNRRMYETDIFGVPLEQYRRGYPAARDMSDEEMDIFGRGVVQKGRHPIKDYARGAEDDEVGGMAVAAGLEAAKRGILDPRARFFNTRDEDLEKKEEEGLEAAESVESAAKRAIDLFLGKRDEEENEIKGMEVAETVRSLGRRAASAWEDNFMGKRDDDEEEELTGMRAAEGVETLARRAAEFRDEYFRKRNEEQDEVTGLEAAEAVENLARRAADYRDNFLSRRDESSEEEEEEAGMQVAEGVQGLARRAAELRDAFFEKRDEEEDEVGGMKVAAEEVKRAARRALLMRALNRRSSEGEEQEIEGMESAEGLQGAVKRALEGLEQYRREAEYKRAEGARAARALGDQVSQAKLQRALRSLLERSFAEDE